MVHKGRYASSQCLFRRYKSIRGPAAWPNGSSISSSLDELSAVSQCKRVPGFACRKTEPKPRSSVRSRAPRASDITDSDGCFDVFGSRSGQLISQSHQNGHSESDIEARRTIPFAAQCAHLAVWRTVHGAHTMPRHSVSTVSLRDDARRTRPDKSTACCIRHNFTPMRVMWISF